VSQADGRKIVTPQLGRCFFNGRDDKMEEESDKIIEKKGGDWGQKIFI